MIPGARFVAQEGSRLFLDAILDGGWQDTCSTAGALQADCINLAGGSTEGVTLVTLNTTPVADGGAYSSKGIALIDVSGGTSDASHFVLDPNSPNYQDADDMLFAGIRASELFSYSLFYDESTQTHRLVGVPTAPFLTLGVLPAAAQSLWRVVDQAGSARLAELRQAKAGAGGGFWFKYVDSDTERDATSNVTLFGQTASAAADYDQSSRGYLFGADFVGNEGDSAYAFGVSVGDLDSKVRLTAGSVDVDMMALAINVYGSYRSGGFFLDMSGGGYSGDLEGDFFVGSLSTALDGKINAFGARADTGWRMGLGNSFAVEPMVGVIFMRSGLSDINHLPGSAVNGMRFDAANSFRGGAGARGSFESAFAGMKLGLSLTGRVWQEFDGEARSSMRTRVDSLPYTSEFDGTFTELSAAIDLSALEGALSGYLEFGSQSGDDYDSTTGTLGVRYNW
jgi:outer membrane autotransporter protein